MIEYPNKLKIIFDKLDLYNINPIIIGGYVRDKLLNIPSKDIDIELYGLSHLEKLEEILAEFGEINSVGKSFGVCKLSFNGLDLDFSLPRSDNKIDTGHKGFLITTDANLDFKTATSRRDFTINAIGYDVKTKMLLDPFNGIEDLKNRILRAVDLNKFDEDPLRVLRAVQFSSRLNFKIEDNLFNKCKSMINAAVLEELPKERIFQEIKKLFLKSPKPSVGFALLKEIAAFSYFKELNKLGSSEYTRLLLAFDRLAAFNVQNEHTRLSLFLTLISSYLTHADTQSFLQRLTNKQALINDVNTLVKHKNIVDIDKYTDFDLLFASTKLKLVNYLFFLNALYPEKSLILENIKSEAIRLGVLEEAIKPFIGGKDLIELGLKPSKNFSKILDKIYMAQLRAAFNDKKTALEFAKALVIC